MPVKVPGAIPRENVAVTWSTLSGKPTSFPPSAHSHKWDEITGKPAVYPPAAPAWVDVAGKPTTFPPAAHSHSWADITGKPATFPPSAHTHAWGDIADKPTSFPPAAHTHAGLLQFIGNVTVSETTLLSLALGMKRMTVTLAGVIPADRLMFAALPGATNGCEAVNVYPDPNTAGRVIVAYFTPALGLASNYSIPIAVYRITS